MSKEIVSFSINELERMRVACKRCGGVVELPVSNVAISQETAGVYCGS